MIKLSPPDKKITYAIGIDLGGTYIKSAVVSSSGRISNEYKLPSFAEQNPQKVVSQIEKAISRLIKKDKSVSGIGIGAPGIVRDGIVKYPPNFRGWNIVNLKNIIAKKFKMKVEVDNDAKCAGLAELKFGHGKRIKNFLLLTLGTGIGGAVIIDGKIYRGETFGAGEFGMMTINFNGPACLGGNPGAVEAYIGRNYFLANEKSEIDKLGKKLVPAGFKQGIDFKDLSALARKNNKTAKSLYEKYGFHLGVGLANYFNLMDVRTCVLTGGIAGAYDYFIGECRRTIKERSLPTIKNEFKVLKSKISNGAGLLGAASLIFEHEL